MFLQLSVAGSTARVEIKMISFRLVWLAAFFCIFATLWEARAWASAKIENVSLCQLTDDPSRFQGKRVRLTADLHTSEHGAFLSSHACKKRSITWSQISKFRGDRILDKVPVDSSGLPGPYRVVVDGIFVYRTDVSPNERNPFLFCATRVRNAIGADWDADEVSYGRDILQPGPIAIIEPIPCPVFDTEW